MQTNVGELKTFQSLLDDNPETFHCTRTSRSLQYHWALMRHMCLLCDQDGGSSEYYSVRARSAVLNVG